MLIYFLISFSYISAASITENQSPPNQPKQSFSKFENKINQKLTATEIDSLQNFFQTKIILKDIPADTTPADIVQWLLNALGGLLTTIILYFLHKWFPKIFPTARKSDYK